MIAFPLFLISYSIIFLKHEPFIFFSNKDLPILYLDDRIEKICPKHCTSLCQMRRKLWFQRQHKLGIFTLIIA